MKLHIVFGQRKCSYEGEYAPEALAIADQYTMDANPDYLEGEYAKHKEDKSFASVAVIVVDVPRAEIDRRLDPALVPVEGKIQ